jgi:hypothetical protein
MKTDQPKNTAAVFLQTIAVAVAQLKQRLQKDYEQIYPNLREVIRLVLDEEEAKAWELTLFPHLLLPDLVDAHIANLNLQPAKTNHSDLFAISHFSPIPRYKPVAALCG